jgi:phosphatidylethanolamine-binding protein (PEBP) family uncharacterized protein
MTLQLSIPDWTHQISSIHLCPNYGNNISPSLSWNSSLNNNRIKSYALILQDVSAHDYIHWYIPYISPSLNKIYNLENKNILKSNISQIFDFYKKNDEMKVKQGFNSRNTLGYSGPCPPEGTGSHEYIFYFMALDDDIFFKSINKDILLPKRYEEFRNILKEKNINILMETKVSGFFER